MRKEEEAVEVEEVKGTECPFCNLDPARNPILWRGGEAIVLLSNPRLAPWHMLIIPERHIQHLWELSPAERERLFSVAIMFQKRMMEVLSERWNVVVGCDLVQHDRPFMPTNNISVPEHLHLHLIPRSWQDNLYNRVSKYETDAFEEFSDEGVITRTDELRRLLAIF